MGYDKGQSGNPAGRPKGSRNKDSLLRDRVTKFLTDEFPTIKADFESLKPRDRVKLFIDLMPFGLAKLQAVTIDVDSDIEKMIDRLTDEELETVVQRLLEKA